MPLCVRHLALQTRRRAVLGLSLAAITGCQSLSSSNGALARVRVIDVSPDAPAVDIYQGNNAVAYNVSFGTITSYLPVAPGSSTMTVDAAGSRQMLSSVEGAFAADGHYTVLVSSSMANLQQIVLADHLPALASKSQPGPMVRFIHQATRTSAVDIYLVPAGQRLASVTPVVTSLAVGANTGYLAVPSCTCTAIMLPAGTVPSATNAAVHTGAQSRLLNGSSRTVILLDAPPTASSAMQVITAIDAEPAS